MLSVELLSDKAPLFVAFDLELQPVLDLPRCIDLQWLRHVLQAVSMYQCHEVLNILRGVQHTIRPSWSFIFEVFVPFSSGHRTSPAWPARSRGPPCHGAGRLRCCDGTRKRGGRERVLAMTIRTGKATGSFLTNSHRYHSVLFITVSFETLGNKKQTPPKACPYGRGTHCSRTMTKI